MKLGVVAYLLVVSGILVAFYGASLFIINDFNSKAATEQVGDFIEQPDAPAVFVHEERSIPDLGLTLMPISSGKFNMGSDFGPPDEAPIHEVTLTDSFWMGKTEVTWGEFGAVLRDYRDQARTQGDFPVANVGWHEAHKFCVELTAREFKAGRLPAGYVYRLPTEAEWEYAARAGSAGAYAGDLENLGWYGDNSDKMVHPVAQKQPNAWGLYDMHGNVWEWNSDWYGAEVYSETNRVNPKGPASGEVKSCRGGSWGWAARHSRSANRHWAGAQYCGQHIGLRVVLAPVN